MLGYLPLAIDQAAAYISAREISLEAYSKEYGRSRASLLLTKPKALRAHRYAESVYTTWEVSFNAIAKENKRAVELLQFFAFLSNDDIWEDLIRQCFHVPEHGMDQPLLIKLPVNSSSD
jgi:hypothetical protein